MPGLPWGFAQAQMIEDDGGAVGELGDEFEFAAHAFDVMAQRGQQHVAAFFQARNGVLAHAQLSGQIRLGLLGGQAQVFEGGQGHGTLFNPRAALGGQSGHDVIEFFCHVANPLLTDRR